ncbi:hypothetical protein BC829DRAFT_388388, partial [Chytridium lagenaria]
MNDVARLNAILKDKEELAWTFSEDIKVISPALSKQATAASTDLPFGLRPRWRPTGETIVVEETLIKSLEKLCEQKTKELAKLNSERATVRQENPTVQIPPFDFATKTTQQDHHQSGLRIPGQEKDEWWTSIKAMEEFNEGLGVRVPVKTPSAAPEPGLCHSLKVSEEAWDEVTAFMHDLKTVSVELGGAV